MVIGLSRRNSVRRPSAYSEFGRQPNEGEADFMLSGSARQPSGW